MKKFVARQAIFDRGQNIYGYELLFRSGLENYFQGENPDHASSSVVVDSLLLMGMKSLTGGRIAFINFTKKLLIDEYATLLPREQAIVEILESVDPEERVVAACKDLKDRGYVLALDDFVLDDRLKPLIDLVDIIKVDFLKTPPVTRRLLVQQFAPRGIRLIAEKVETPDEFCEADQMGYTYFQGFFFSKPEIITGRDIPAYKLNYLRLLQAINHTQPDLLQLEGIIKQESSLCYKLLRYLNSAFFFFRSEIASIRHALALLGINEVRKWVSLVALAAMGEDKPAGLVIDSMVRARFCETLAPKVGLRDQTTDIFLMGLLSMMDVILERPLSEILAEVAVSANVKRALLDGTGDLRDVYEVILAYEKGEWEKIARLAIRLKIDEAEIAEVYLQAVEWGEQIFQIKASETKFAR